MKTLKLEITKENISLAARIINESGVVAMPTETVYGLAASALDEDAVRKVFEAKGRPQDNPLIVHISDMEMLYPLITSLPEKARLCAEKFWPGPFTMVLPKTDVIPSSVSAGLDTVAVRMPSNEVARDFIRACNVPIAAPSANISGLPSPTTAEHVVRDMDSKIDAILMAGDCEVGLESTVVTFATNPPKLLRPGGITAEQLREILPDLEIDKAVLESAEAGKPVASPGMKYKHYSPSCDVTMLIGSSEEYIKYVNSHKEANLCALCFEEDKDSLTCPYICYGKLNDGKSQAAELFDALRLLDDKGYKKCYAHAPNLSGVGLAVYNRLIRAAAFKVIELDNKVIVGLTGPTGSGKTTLCDVAREKGFHIINADLVVREVYKKDIAISALCGAFGNDILSDGQINRKKLAATAFKDSESTELLNKTILPIICDEIKNIIDKSKSKYILLDAPTLFESRLDNICDFIISVISDESIRKSRIMARDNMSEYDANMRLAAAKSDEFFISRSTHIIFNNGTKKEFEIEANNVILNIINNKGE